MEGMHVTLALEAQQFSSINDIFLVEEVGIRQTFLFMIKVDEIRWYLRNLWYVLKQLSYRAIASHLNQDVLSFTAFWRMNPNVDGNDTFKILGIS